MPTSGTFVIKRDGVAITVTFDSEPLSTKRNGPGRKRLMYLYSILCRKCEKDLKSRSPPCCFGAKAHRSPEQVECCDSCYKRQGCEYCTGCNHYKTEEHWFTNDDGQRISVCSKASRKKKRSSEQDSSSEGPSPKRKRGRKSSSPRSDPSSSESSLTVTSNSSSESDSLEVPDADLDCAEAATSSSTEEESKAEEGTMEESQSQNGSDGDQNATTDALDLKATSANSDQECLRDPSGSEDEIPANSYESGTPLVTSESDCFSSEADCLSSEEEPEEVDNSRVIPSGEHWAAPDDVIDSSLFRQQNTQIRSGSEYDIPSIIRDSRGGSVMFSTGEAFFGRGVDSPIPEDSAFLQQYFSTKLAAGTVTPDPCSSIFGVPSFPAGESAAARHLHTVSQ